jgi:hypothetical protein
MEERKPHERLGYQLIADWAHVILLKYISLKYILSSLRKGETESRCDRREFYLSCSHVAVRGADGLRSVVAAMSERANREVDKYSRSN